MIDGIWKAGVIHGFATFNYGQEYFEGFYKNDERNGQGKVVSVSDKRYYAGNFESDSANGKGSVFQTTDDKLKKQSSNWVKGKCDEIRWYSW